MTSHDDLIGRLVRDLTDDDIGREIDGFWMSPGSPDLHGRVKAFDNEAEVVMIVPMELCSIDNWKQFNGYRFPYRESFFREARS